MELAVKVMMSSVQEPRTDEKATPAVGAVAVTPSGEVMTACRGELRHGDHAEYTLLERKNPATLFDGAQLFVTLEPCAQEAREPPKIECAKRIVLARIAEVWIGVEDPDPTVAGEGIKYLEQHGVTVHLFDRDLQDEIEKENSRFLRDAKERAKDAKAPILPALSSLGAPATGYTLDDLSPEAIQAYHSEAKIQEPVDSPEFHRRLVLSGSCVEEDGTVRPTGTGVLLFGKRPRDHMPQAVLLATIHLPDGTEVTEDFDGPLVLVPEAVEAWLGSKLPMAIDRSAMKRRDVSKLIREGVVNALIHRDYDMEGAKSHIIARGDLIEIRSPGGPVRPITLDQLNSLNAPMLSRNPRLHRVFNQMDLAEERQLGMKTFQEEPERLGIPRPTFSMDGPYLSLKIFTTAEAVVAELPDAVQHALSKAEKEGWQYLASQRDASKLDYARSVGVSDRTAVRHLNHFVELGLLRREGEGRATRYAVIVDGK